jgi:hypothetical protein
MERQFYRNGIFEVVMAGKFFCVMLHLLTFQRNLLPLSLGWYKRLGREADHSPPTSAQYSPIHFHCAVLDLLNVGTHFNNNNNNNNKFCCH